MGCKGTWTTFSLFPSYKWVYVKISYIQSNVHILVLDDVESSPERVILYSDVSQAILACLLLPRECKMQADALANAMPMLGWCYGSCDYLPFFRYRQGNAQVSDQWASDPLQHWILLGLNKLTDKILISFKRINNWPGRASLWTRTTFMILKANASSCTWVHSRGSSICRRSNCCMSLSAFLLCGCIPCCYLRRLLQAAMAAATTSNKCWLIPDILPR